MSSKKVPSRSAQRKNKETDVTEAILGTKEISPIRQPHWTAKQRTVVETILNPDSRIVICGGSAGTGKTTIAMHCAVTMLREKQVKKIVYLRSPTENCDSKIGFLPGELEAKMTGYAQAGENVLTELLSKADLETMKANGTFSVAPINFLRGVSFHNTFVILDEASDLSIKELEMVFGRYGKNSKFVVIGDERQSNARKSGFLAVTNMFEDQESKNKGIFTFRFETSDSLRSPITKFILDKFEKLSP